MSMSPPEDPSGITWLEHLERSYQRYARREGLPEDDFQELVLAYLRCLERGQAPKNLWGWADVVLRRLAEHRRTQNSASEPLPEDLLAPDADLAELVQLPELVHRREIWEQIRDRVMEGFPAAYRKAIEIMPECRSMREWASKSRLERVDLRRIIDRVARVAYGFLPQGRPHS